MINSVTLLGSSSGRNAGDAALISGIMDSVDKLCERRLRYDIPTVRPSYVRTNYPNDVRPVGMMPWDLSLKMFGLPTYNSVMNTDLSLIFDAILFDRSLYNPLFNYLSTVYLMLPRAKKRGKLMGFYNVGTGPVKTAAGKKMLRELSELMDFITVRDQDSYDLLRDIGVQNPRMIVCADAALNVTPASESRVSQIMNQVGIKDDEQILSINVNRYLDSWANLDRAPSTREKFVQIYSQALSKVMKEIGGTLMFVCTQHHDVEISNEVMQAVNYSGKKVLISNVNYNHYDIQGVFSRAQLMFGMRLHSIILASSVLTPVIGIEYQPKVTHYLKTAGLKDYTMSFNDFSVEALSAHILSGWEKRIQIRTILEGSIPRLQREANRAAEIVAALSRGEDLDRVFAGFSSSTEQRVAQR